MAFPLLAPAALATFIAFLFKSVFVRIALAIGLTIGVYTGLIVSLNQLETFILSTLDSFGTSLGSLWFIAIRFGVVDALTWFISALISIAGLKFSVGAIRRLSLSG